MLTNRSCGCGKNRGFRVNHSSVLMYVQEHAALTYFYAKCVVEHRSRGRVNKKVRVVDRLQTLSWTCVVAGPKGCVFIRYTMSERVKRHILGLQMFTRHKNVKLRKAIIANADADFLCCLAECSYNIIKGNVPLTAAHKKKLKKYKTYMRTLSKKKTSAKQKKEILQNGGFLSAFLAPLASTVLAPLLGQLLR